MKIINDPLPEFKSSKILKINSDYPILIIKR